MPRQWRMRSEKVFFSLEFLLKHNSIWGGTERGETAFFSWNCKISSTHTREREKGKGKEQNEKNKFNFPWDVFRRAKRRESGNEMKLAQGEGTVSGEIECKSFSFLSREPGERHTKVYKSFLRFLHVWLPRERIRFSLLSLPLFWRWQDWSLLFDFPLRVMRKV